MKKDYSINVNFLNFDIIVELKTFFSPGLDREK